MQALSRTNPTAEKRQNLIQDNTNLKPQYEDQLNIRNEGQKLGKFCREKSSYNHRKSDIPLFSLRLRDLVVHGGTLLKS